MGFPPGMEEPKWQGTAAGFALCSISALEAVAVRMSQLSAAGSSDLMTAFHQQSSCHFCLFSFCACLAMQVASSTQKSPAAQVREKGSRLFAVLGREKVLHRCSSTSLLICRFLFPWAFWKPRLHFIKCWVSVLLNQLEKTRARQIFCPPPPRPDHHNYRPQDSTETCDWKFPKCYFCSPRSLGETSHFKPCRSPGSVKVCPSIKSFQQWPSSAFQDRI